MFTVNSTKNMGGRLPNVSIFLLLSYLPYFGRTIRPQIVLRLETLESATNIRIGLVTVCTTIFSGLMSVRPKV